MKITRCIVFIMVFITVPIQAQGDNPEGKFTSDQLFSRWKTKDGKSILVNASNKYNTPLGPRVGARNLNASYTRKNTQINHPAGSQLFPGTLASLFDNFLTSIENNTYFLVYFSRIHLFILHELYTYLTKIYTTFNMTHVNTIEDYLRNTTNQALNKKTLIINHLITIIETQSNQAILARFPAIPQHIATNIGFAMMKQDYGADLNLMIEKQEEVFFTDPTGQQMVKQMRSDYLTIFGNYLKFFKGFTAALEQQDPFVGSTFVTYAQNVQRVIDAQKPQINKNVSGKDQASALLQLKTINPPLFFYDDETIRCVKIIPKLASALPKNSQKVPWPDKVVQDARTQSPITNKAGNVISNAPTAYFKDAQGNITSNQGSAVKLFINIPTLQNMYTQELIPQPEWLNSTQGVLLMLRACLGDFTALFDPLFRGQEIFDPCISCIISNAAVKAGLMIGNADFKKTCDDCQSYLAQVRTLIEQAQYTTPPLPPLDTSLEQPS